VAGEKPLFDSIQSIVEILNSKSSLQKDVTERVLILITSGVDTKFWDPGGTVINSRDVVDLRNKAKRRVIKLVKESGIRVYAIGITSYLDRTDMASLTGQSPRAQAEEFLEKLTKAGGGRLVFVKSKKVNVEKLVYGLLEK
jgi:hypothetical protein